MYSQQFVQDGESIRTQLPRRTNPSNAVARFLTLLLLVLFMPHLVFAAGPAPVNLLSTANFTILAGAAITTTGGGIINGDIGASPIAGSAIGIPCDQVNGTIYEVDASGPPCAVINPTLLSQAKNDLTTAMNDAAGRTPIPSGAYLNPNGGNLGGLNLAAGLYKITTTTLITGSDLTLTGGPNDVWIFQCAQDIQLGSGIHVILAGSAQAGNIFWQVGTSAVLGTYSTFNGTILASQAITMMTGSTMNGRALAFSAGVTFNGTGAAVPSPTASGIGVQQPLGTNLVNGSVTNDFGPVAVGASSLLTFTITNTGTTNLTILRVTIDGTNAPLFSVTTNPATSLIPGGTTTFTVRFAPVGDGVQTAVLHISNNDINNNPFNIVITGTGTGAAVVPGIVVQQPAGTNLVNGVGTESFGSETVGVVTNLTFVITNIGTANLTGLDITIDGANPAMFTVTAAPTSPVIPGGFTTFTVGFTPSSTGAKTAALHIADNDLNNNPFNIALTGTGTDAAILVSTNIFVNTNSAGITVLYMDPQSGLFTNSVLVTNTGPNTIPAVRLYILNLPSDVQVYDASGFTTNGTPYVQYNFPVAPAASIDMWIQYYRASRQPFLMPTYVPQDLTNAVTLSVTNGRPVPINNIVMLNGKILIGFYASPGRTYAVQYSTNMIVWQTASPFIVAPANYVQWYDEGPPATETLSSTRYYRAFVMH